MRGVALGLQAAGRLSGGPMESGNLEPEADPPAADPSGGPPGDPSQGKLQLPGLAVGGTAPTPKSLSGGPPRTAQA